MVVGEILASSTELYKEDPQLNLIPRKGVGELLISSHGDDQRIFLGLKSSILGFLGEGTIWRFVVAPTYPRAMYFCKWSITKLVLLLLDHGFFGVLILPPFHHPCHLKSRVTSSPPPPPPHLGNLIQIHWIDYTKSLRFERRLFPSLTKGIKSPFYCRYLVGKIH